MPETEFGFCHDCQRLAELYQRTYERELVAVRRADELERQLEELKKASVGLVILVSERIAELRIALAMIGREPHDANAGYRLADGTVEAVASTPTPVHASPASALPD